MLTSVMTSIEITTKPLMLGDQKSAARLRDFLVNTDGLRMLPIDLEVADEASRIRARYKLKTPDAIQVATAITHGADLIVTNDKQWQRLEEITVLQLSDLIDEAP